MPVRVAAGLGVCALTAQTFAARLALLHRLPGPTGYDVYYYAVQTRSLLERGRLWWPDRSLVFPVLAVLARATGDVLGAIELAAAGSGALLLLPVYAMALRLSGDRLVALSALAACAASTVHLFFSLEFLKNSVAVVFFAAYLASLFHAVRSGNAHHRLVAALAAILWATLAASTHWSMGLLAIIAALPIGVAALVRGFYLASLAVAGACAALLGLMPASSFARLAAALRANIAIFSCSAPECLARCPAIGLGAQCLGEIALYYVVGTASVVVLVMGISGRGLLSRRPRDLVIIACLACVNLTLLGPIWRCDWNGPFFRLLRLALVPSIATCVLLATRTGLRARRTASALLVVAGTLTVWQQPSLSSTYVAFHPNYGLARDALPRLKALLPNDAVVVAPHGWQFLVTWATGHSASARPPVELKDSAVFVLEIGEAVPPPGVAEYRCPEPLEPPVELSPGFRLVRCLPSDSR